MEWKAGEIGKAALKRAPIAFAAISAFSAASALAAAASSVAAGDIRAATHEAAAAGAFAASAVVGVASTPFPPLLIPAAGVQLSLEMLGDRLRAKKDEATPSSSIETDNDEYRGTIWSP